MFRELWPTPIRPTSVGSAQEWWRQAAGERPAIFRAGDFAAWQEALAAEKVSSGLRAVVGAPVSPGEEVRAVDLMAGAEQALAVVGPDAALAQRVLARMVGTAVASCKGPVEVVLLEGQSTAVHDYPPRLSSQQSHQPGHEGRTRRAGRRRSVVRYLATGRRERSQDHPRSSRPRRRRRSPASRCPEVSDLPVEHLRDWVRTGATRGVFVIGWWQSRYQLEQHLGFGAPGVRGWALAGLWLRGCSGCLRTDGVPATSPSAHPLVRPCWVE